MGVVDVFVAELAEAEDAAACHSVAEKATEALREQEEASKWSREHAAALDKNWSAMHEAAVGAIRAALGMPDASVPEMVARIRNLMTVGFKAP